MMPLNRIILIGCGKSKRSEPTEAAESKGGAEVMEAVIRALRMCQITVSSEAEMQECERGGPCGREGDPMTRRLECALCGTKAERGEGPANLERRGWSMGRGLPSRGRRRCVPVVVCADCTPDDGGGHGAMTDAGIYSRGGERAVRAIRRQYPNLRRGVWRRLDVPPGMLARGPYRGETVECIYLDYDFSVTAARRWTEWGDVQHLQCRRHDLSRMVLWADLQRIKDGVVGAEATAIQVHPPEDQLVDEVNAYHLWVLPAGFDLPFDLRGRS